jgi:hypothetical protein
VKTTRTVLLAILLAAGEEMTDLMQLYMIINLYIYIVGNNNLKYIVKYCYSKVLLLFLLGSVS